MMQEDFNLLAGVVKERSGLQLSPDKSYLVENRLLPVARRFGFRGLDDLATAVRNKRDATLLREVTEAMTTNESMFFRDPQSFQALKTELVPRLMAARQRTRTLRVWSAASSSGQEAYSIAMLIKDEPAKFADWRIEILGTDISIEMLEKARAGVYSQFEVQRGLPIQYLVKYLKQLGDKWQIVSALRAIVRFKEFNLLEDPRTLGTFDVILCCNALIYFDHPTKMLVLERLARLLPPDGVLLLGGAETVIGLSDRYQPVSGQRGIYVLAQAPTVHVAM
jgi:chemotaxis protein methyltransferase CheR